MIKNKPHIVVRLAIVGAIGFLASCERNPLVRVEAILGLSPAPLERFTGMRTVFSGMTEAAYDLAHLQVIAAIRSNVLSPIMAAAAVVSIAIWRFPKATPAKEPLLLASAIAGSIVVDSAWRVLN